MNKNKKFLISEIFLDYALFEIFILGIISGMPFSILYTNLMVMLKDIGFTLAITTNLALALIPYSLKFLWAPLVDNISIPFLKQFGQRKSWMLLSIILGILIILSIYYISIWQNFNYILLTASIYCFIAATYDIAYDAWRIERVSPDKIAMSASIAILGYRIGALITSSGILILNGATNSWPLTMKVISIIFTLGAIFIITVKEPSKPQKKSYNIASLYETFIVPLKEFLSRPMAMKILLMIICYKAGEAMIAFVTTQFYLELGFSKIQIGSVLKGFGFFATTIGTIIGGILCIKMGYFRALILCGIVQMLSNLSFIWMNAQGAWIYGLFITVSIDNISGGMGTAALIGYLGYLCNKRYTATQYALFSSASTLINHTLVAYSGKLITYFGWNNFFILTIFMSLPSIYLLHIIYKNNNN